MQTNASTRLLRTRTVHSWTRRTAIALIVGITALELLHCSGALGVPEGLPFGVLYALVIVAFPFFVGMAVRQWTAAIFGGLLGLYALVWACQLVSVQQTLDYGPFWGLVVMLMAPVGWLAMALGWLGSRAPWLLLHAPEWARR